MIIEKVISFYLHGDCSNDLSVSGLYLFLFSIRQIIRTFVRYEI